MLKPKRKSGWLVPRVGYDSSGGAVVTAPYYFNLAPNYDLTIDNMIYYQRGLAFNPLFRYLFANMEGAVKAGVVVHDRKFDRFRTHVLSSPEIVGSSERSRKVLIDNNLLWRKIFNFYSFVSKYVYKYNTNFFAQLFYWNRNCICKSNL